MLSHFLLTSLPNYLTIFLAIGLFCSLYPIREGAAWRLGVCGALCVAISLASALLHYFAAPALTDAHGDVVYRATSGLFFVLVLLACPLVERLVFELSLWDAVFCATAGYALQNFAHSLWETLAVLAPAELALPDVVMTLLQLLLTAAVLAVAYLTVIRHIRINHLEGEGDRRTVIVLGAVILVNIVFDIAIRSLQEGGLVSEVPFFLLRLSQLMACALTLILNYEILYSNRMRADAAATRQMMEDQRRQYELSRDTIEAINVRCHDIRHQVRLLSSSSEGGRTFVEDVSDLISIYDAGVQTSNEALDVILTEKSLLCQSRGIGLTCTADGRAISFMAEQDVYSLFGNALDNAIEAAEKVSDPDRRLIDVSARSVGKMAVIQVRNFYDGELVLANGVPQTTKTDGGLHGYGMRSLRLIAERYGGSVSVDAQDGMFRLHVLLPRPDEAQVPEAS